MPYPKLRTQRSFDGAVLRLILDSPRGNVLDAEMIGSLRRAVADEAGGPGIKALVLEGAGDHFSFGASVAEHRPGEIDKVLPAFHALFRELLEVARPMLAVVRGNCLGGGLELIKATADARGLSADGTVLVDRSTDTAGRAPFLRRPYRRRYDLLVGGREVD